MMFRRSGLIYVLFGCLVLACFASGSRYSHRYARVLVSRHEGSGAVPYRFTLDHIEANGKWHQITGQNARPGDISYFTAYSSPFPEETLSYDVFTTVGGFTKKMYVCYRDIRIGRNEESETWVISSRPCSELGRRWDEDFVFYAADEEKDNTQAIYVALCQAEDMVYGRVSAAPSVCHAGHTELGRDTFYAFIGKTMCDFADIPQNGHINSRDYVDGVYVKQVKFGCSPGHTLSGSETITCGRNGHWAGSPPTCTAISCGRPRTPHRADIQGNSFNYLDQVTFKCKRGYNVIPEGARIQCMETGRWTETDASCQSVNCGFPGEILNGDVQGTQYTFRKNVRFSCESGYFLQGAARANCRANGRWSKPLPRCQQITCPALLQPQNGMFVGTDFTANKEVIFRCHHGYRLVGSDVIRCNVHGSNGNWSANIPTCEKISCPQPDTPQNGDVLGTDFSYGHSVTFVCNPGYVLQGSDSKTCLETGWDSQETPSCQAIHCKDPGVPANGNRQGNGMVYGNILTFSCLPGYLLKGSRTLACGEDGQWSSGTPMCEAVQCPPIGTPEHGSRDSDAFQYGGNVTFSCFPGYELDGAAVSRCMEDGTWSATTPLCKACTIGTYKSGADNSTCLSCPEGATTHSDGSFSPEHCVCQDGSQKTPEGHCTVIECEEFLNITNGSVGSCGRHHNDECYFTCNAGYVLQGSRIRKCTQYGWNGRPASCHLCPPNTFKEREGSISCTPCPVHTVTNGNVGASHTSCECAEGYRGPPGGPCSDIDECASGNGNCSDTCENMAGGFRCTCSVPGSVLEEDGKTCILNQTCPALVQSLDHGGLQCRHHEKQNGNICHIKCDPGYFFVSGVNNYITCGPDTEYIWSHRRVNSTARIPACTQEFFVDIHLPISLRYVSAQSCNGQLLSPRLLRMRIEESIQALNVCRGLCEVHDLEVQCEDNEENHGSDLMVDFNILLQNPHENAILPSCDPICKRMNMRQMLRQTFKLKNAMSNLVSVKPEDLELTDLPTPVLDRTSFEYRKPQMLCDPGRVLTKHRLCVPCDVGYYLPRRDVLSCVPCPQGTYQHELGQTQCKPCYAGSTTLTEGSSHPTMCNIRITTINVNVTEPAVNPDYNDYENDNDELILSF